MRPLGRYQHLDHSEGPVVSEPSPQQVWLLSAWYHVRTLVYTINRRCLGSRTVFFHAGSPPRDLELIPRSRHVSVTSDAKLGRPCCGKDRRMKGSSPLRPASLDAAEALVHQHLALHLSGQEVTVS